MLYPENKKQNLSDEVFKNPGSEYRATPFWAWNCELNQATLDRQIDCMKKMGFGGFHMHVRVGLTTPYLSDEFMGFIKTCVDKAEQNDMLAWLYDEDKWPSGFAGGLVTKDPELRERFLLFTKTPYGKGKPFSSDDSSARASRAENGTLLCKYAIKLDDDGYLANYRVLGKDEEADENEILRYAYLETKLPSSWFNNQSYVDTLSPKAMQKFIEITHERYFEVVGDKFGNRIPAIFTDEPQFAAKETLPDPFSDKDVILPWTTDFADSFESEYNEKILNSLPELFWELPNGKVSPTRYRYHDHVSERFARAFADQIGSWCEKHNIMLTGHMMSEESLFSQTSFLGDCMRSFRSFQLPGIDLLCDRRELTTAKQAQSAAHQYGRPGVLSELYGVTNWIFPFRKHKLQGDWQAALGVSVRVPHLYWVSMRGEAKRDYPASIGHQSPWYEKYKYLEDHFARVNSAMTRGKPLVKIAVVHPVESYWLHWGPSAQTSKKREEMDSRFHQLADWLCGNLLDYDYIAESLLPSQFDSSNNKFKLGEMSYDVVIVPDLETIRGTTLSALQKFSDKGGKVIFMDSIPKYIDAVPNDAAKIFAEKLDEKSKISWSEFALLNALEDNRLLSITNEQGTAASNLVSQWREDNDARWLFVCHINNTDNYYSTLGRNLTMHIAGNWNAQLYNTFTGEIKELKSNFSNNKTHIDWYAHAQDSILLKLTPKTEDTAGVQLVRENWEEIKLLPAKLPITLSEPNVLLLDMPEYSLDNEEWQEKEEILRITDRCKNKLNLKNDIAGGCQPWVFSDDSSATASHKLKLRYTIHSEIEVEKIKLAIEDIETLKITWNGQAIKAAAEGYYIDEAIKTVSLPALNCGINTLEIEMPFGKITTAEACFILGDFGVKVCGREAKITPAVRELSFSDWTQQGLAFYGGNVTYHTEIDADGSELAICAHHFNQPVLSVALDGEEKGIIAFSPYRCELGAPEKGKHKLEITAYGNRINTFGALHNIHYAETWAGPNAWRTSGDLWSYEYKITPSGIFAAPELLKKV